MVNQFWNEFLSETGRSTALKGVLCFGDSHESADAAAAAVLSGAKTATIYSENGYRVAMKGMPTVGDLNIVVDWAGKPLCVIETVEVSRFCFNSVPDKLRAAEYPGEENWAEKKEAECKRELEELGFEFDENVVLIAEEFQVIYPQKA